MLQCQRLSFSKNKNELVNEAFEAFNNCYSVKSLLIIIKINLLDLCQLILLQIPNFAH